MTIIWPSGRLARAVTSSDEPAAIVAIGSVGTERAIEAAEAQVPARWRLETLVPNASSVTDPPADEDRLTRAYLEADFLRCLPEIEPAFMRLDQLLADGRRPEAARLAIFAAACALGANDEARARELVRRTVDRDLLDPAALRRTTPEFQRVAEDERLAAQRRGRVDVEIVSEPAGAAVRVGGCASAGATPRWSRASTWWRSGPSI